MSKCHKYSVHLTLSMLSNYAHVSIMIVCRWNSKKRETDLYVLKAVCFDIVNVGVIFAFIALYGKFFG
jgi:hypothetical protein